ncbi:hypothetical protein ACHAWC_010840 [Mediolabrus comicus]
MASLKLNNSSYSSRRGALVTSSSSSLLCVSSTLSSASSSCYCYHHRDQSTSSSSSSSSVQHFPWRHSATPLLRIQNNDDYSGMPNNVRAKFVRKLIAIREMNLSFWDALPILPMVLPGYRHEWERELSSNFEIAFRLALEELLCTLFSDNGSDVVHNENQCISIDTSKMTTRRKNASADTADANDETTKTSSQSASIESNDYLNQMIDQTLLQKYQQLDLQHLQLKLTIKPIPVQLQNIFAVPMLTREIVNQKPHLKGAYQRLEKVYKETKSYAEVKQKTYELAEEVGLQSAKRTVIADVSIRCLEYFQVKDVRTGEIVQGMGDDEDEEEVVHLVRFEMVTDRKKKDNNNNNNTGERDIGSWKIIDVDDLLDGNVFH